MKSNFLLVALCLAICGILNAADAGAARALETAPLRFEPTAPGSRAPFVARGSHYYFEFTRDEASLRSGARNVRLHFAGVNPNSAISGAQLERSTTNVYLGNDPSQWRRHIPNFARLQVRDLYSGIDLAYYGNGQQLEYDLMVKPGADPQRIRFDLQGGESNLDRQGDLVSELIQKRPVAYQIAADGSRQFIRSRYRKNPDGSYGFALGQYDHSRELVIDPVLIVAQYFSGSYQDIAVGMGHDANGLIYVGGNTNSSDFPTAGSPYQGSNAGGSDIFLAVINPTLSLGSQVIYATYIGGQNDDTFGGMSVSASGDVYMTGTTDSANFPVQNPPQKLLAGSTAATDAFVLWMDPGQNLKFSTYFGGSEADKGMGIAADPRGRLWVVGDTSSTDLPQTTGFQGSLIGTQNLFIAGFDPSQSGGKTEFYSIYLGGTHWDDAYAIAVAPDNTLWIAGGTYSPDIWIAGNPYQGAYGGDGDAYFAHIDPTLGAKALLYASFFGGSGIDEATSMVLDPSGRIILSGYTLSPNLPITSTAFQQKYGGDTDGFVAIVDPTASQLVYSTYFGGAGPDTFFDMKQDSAGLLYLSGYTESGGLPGTANALQPSYDGTLDAFGLKLDPSKAGADGIAYFTYLGNPGAEAGVQIGYAADFDSKGDLFVAGSTSTGLLAGFGGPGRSSLNGNIDAFVIGFPAAASPSAPVTSASIAPRRFHHPRWRVIPHR